MRNALGVVLIGLVLLCTGCVMLEPMGYVPRFESEDCSFEIPAGARVECGFVTVPEERAGDLGDTIEVAIAIFEARSRIKGEYPIVYLEGGPGGAAIESVLASYPLFLRRVTQRHDVIVIDQRGTGYSRPSLVCSEAKELFDSMATALASEGEGYFEDACFARLIEEGVNPSGYDTVENAADVRDVLIALGHEKAILYGSSYGTMLALTVMRNHPDYIYSAILDGVAPPEVNRHTDLIGKISAGIERVIQACAERTVCAESYPDLRDVYYDLVAHFDREPAVMYAVNPVSGEREEVELDASTFVSLSFFLLFVDQNIALWPQIIYEVRDGDYSTLERYASLLVDLTISDMLSHGMNLLINCADQVMVDQPPDVESMVARYPELEPYVRDYYNEYLVDAAQECAEWGAQPASRDSLAPVVSDIPVLLMNGEFDVQTPVEWSELAAANLSRHFSVTVPGMGHVTAMKGECPLEIMLQFVEVPTVQPDVSCLDEMPKLVFAAPGVQMPTQVIEARGADGSIASTIVPATWAAVPDQPGMYASPDGTQVVLLLIGPGFADLDDLVDAFGGKSPAEYTEESLDNFDWEIARVVDEDDNHVIIAAARDRQHLYVVVGVSASLVTNVEHFYETILLPALEGLIVEEERQGS